MCAPRTVLLVRVELLVRTKSNLSLFDLRPLSIHPIVLMAIHFILGGDQAKLQSENLPSVNVEDSVESIRVESIRFIRYDEIERGMDLLWRMEGERRTASKHGGK